MDFWNYFLKWISDAGFEQNTLKNPCSKLHLRADRRERKVQNLGSSFVNDKISVPSFVIQTEVPKFCHLCSLQSDLNYYLLLAILGLIDHEMDFDINLFFVKVRLQGT